MVTTESPVATLVQRLESLKSLQTCPRAELEWLAEHGEFRRYAAGDVVLSTKEESREMIVMFSGRIVVYFGHGAGRRHSAESREGSITGLLPFSRLKSPPSDVLAEEETELIAIHRRLFPEMLHNCPVLVESLVHNMVDRARRFAAADWQDEKVMSLGRLAAGLAHELNNPAAAASSDATRLASALRDVGLSAHEFGLSTLDPAQRTLVLDAVDQCQGSNRSIVVSTAERMEAEDSVSEWLGRHDIADDVAMSLVDGGVPIETLDQLAGSLSAESLARAVRWVAASAAASNLATNVRRATQRMCDVVSAIRDFSHMDRAVVREPTDVAQGLADTINITRHGANASGVTLTLDIGPSLPKVAAVAADLNQVWSHLVGNAVYATAGDGEVDVRAMLDGHTVVVAVRDNGPGIPVHLQSRIFDPFFTTKPVGEGIGLGLDTVRRTVSDFGGEVEFESQPGRTEFRVRLPAVPAPS